MRKNQILIVEDEEKLMRTMSDYLKLQGYGVLCASDGPEAREFDSRIKEKVL